MTTVAWLRHLVRSHPGYRMDSVVTDEIAYDLVVACQEIGSGKRACRSCYRGSDDSGDFQRRGVGR